MSSETLITVVSFAIAVYALLPAERSLDLKIKFAWYDWTIVMSALAVLHYMVYLPVLRENGLALPLGPWRWGFTPELATYSILAATAFWVWFRSHFGKLGRRQIYAFSELATKLLYQRKNGELAELLNRHLPRLMKIHNNKFPLQHLRDWLCPPLWNTLTRARNQRPMVMKHLRSKLALLLPSYETTRDCARETVHRIMLSDPFVHQVSTDYPYLGIKILGYDFNEKEGFQQKWLTGLLNDPNSVLYHEMANNQTNRGGARHRYDYSPENRCLRFYFHDVKVAEKLKLYRSIGDYLTQFFDALSQDPKRDRFNQPLRRYPDLEIGNCPAYGVIRLFDFMISESLYQGIPWHMWLHYLTSFAEKIERNYSPSNEVNLASEFPTPYHYLLYDLVTLLCNWIASAIDLPEGEAPSPDDVRVPMQSVIVLNRVMNTVVLSEKFDDRFAIYMLELVVGQADDWRHEPKMVPYFDLLLSRLSTGGRDYGIPTTWPERISSLLNEVDHPKYHETKKQLFSLIDAHWAE